MSSALLSLHVAVEPTEAEALEVGLAWAGCTVDGHLHVDQYRALRAVLARHAADPQRVAPPRPAEALEQVSLRREALDLETRWRLFLTTAWVTLADGRAHGRELWLLCELRRALGLAPKEARRLLDLARAARRGAKGRPTLRELEGLLDRALQAA
jgi:hypothetical protein